MVMWHEAVNIVARLEVFPKFLQQCCHQFWYKKALLHDKLSGLPPSYTAWIFTTLTKSCVKSHTSLSIQSLESMDSKESLTSVSSIEAQDRHISMVTVSPWAELLMIRPTLIYYYGVLCNVILLSRWFFLRASIVFPNNRSHFSLAHL